MGYNTYLVKYNYVFAVNEIPGWNTFCGRSSAIFDIAKEKVNFAVVSIAGGCPFTFGHEIGIDYYIFC